MVAYSFQRRFIDPIVSGSKLQTIRSKGKRTHARPGNMLQLYFGLRTKHAVKIIDDATCTRADRIRINFGLRTIVIGPDGGPIIQGRFDLDRFADLDGFEDWEDLSTFWKEWHPEQPFFDGMMVGWGAGFWPPPPCDHELDGIEFCDLCGFGSTLDRP